MSQYPQIVERILHYLDEIQTSDVVVLDVKDMTSITDFMIIATGRSSRHVKASAESIIEQMKHQKTPPLSVSGLDSADWALLDFGDAIVHIMQAETRAHYNIEGLWAPA